MEPVLFAVLVVIFVGAVVSALLTFVYRNETSTPAQLFQARTAQERRLGLVAVDVGQFLLVQTLSWFAVAGTIAALLSWQGTGVLALTASVVVAVFGLSLPQQLLLARVSAEKTRMAEAVGVFEQLAAVAVAGGSDVSFALRTSASLGQGLSWDRLRAAADNSLYSQTTFATQLSQLAQAYNSAELRNLTNLVVISEEGGLAQNSLEQLSASQSRAEANRVADLAERNMAKMVVPVGFLFASFALFIGALISHVLSEVNL